MQKRRSRKPKSINSFYELRKKFFSEELCVKYLKDAVWSGKPYCPHCLESKIYEFSDGKRYKCANCRKIFSITVGTVMENTKLPLSKWFMAIYLVSAHKKGISSTQLARDIEVTQRTAWFVLHRIREMLRDKAPSMLGGLVQMDETLVGGKNKNRHEHKKIKHSQGRSLKDKASVFGMVQPGGKKLFIKHVKNTKAETLKPIIKKMVKDQTIIVTDEWKSYGFLKKHIVINHKQGEYVRGAFDTNIIENFWSLFKRGIFGIYHHVSKKHLDRYCDEFSYRYNTREMKDAERFNQALKKCASSRLKYKDLVKKAA